MSEDTGTRVVVGGKGKRRDVESPSLTAGWQTDIIDNRDPDYVYQFFLESQVRDKLRGGAVQVFDFEAGAPRVYQLPGWEVCHRDAGPEELAGFRPDEGKPLDTVLRHGPHVAMKIHRKHWDILQRMQEHRADSYDQVLNRGHQEEYAEGGRQISPKRSAKVLPGHTRMIQQPLERE